MYFKMLTLFLCLKKKLPKCLYPEILKHYNKNIYKYYGLVKKNHTICSEITYIKKLGLLLQFNLPKFEKSTYERKHQIIMAYSSDNLELFKKYYNLNLNSRVLQESQTQEFISTIFFKKAFKHKNYNILKYLIQNSAYPELIVLCVYYNKLMEFIDKNKYKQYVLRGLFMRGDLIEIDEFISCYKISDSDAKVLSGAAYKFPDIIDRYGSQFEAFSMACIDNAYDYCDYYNLDNVIIDTEGLMYIVKLASIRDDILILKKIIKHDLISVTDLIKQFNHNSKCYTFLLSL